MDLQVVGRGTIDWIAVIQVRVRWRAFVNAVMNRLVP